MTDFFTTFRRGVPLPPVHGNQMSVIITVALSFRRMQMDDRGWQDASCRGRKVPRRNTVLMHEAARRRGRGDLDPQLRHSVITASMGSPERSQSIHLDWKQFKRRWTMFAFTRESALRQHSSSRRVQCAWGGERAKKDSPMRTCA